MDSHEDSIRPGRRGSRLEIEWLGCMAFDDARVLQEETVRQRRAGECGDRLLLLEHPPVVTLGRGSRAENVLLSPSELEARGIDCFEVARGGDVTYHAPGQLVGYLVVDLAARSRPDVGRFLRGIEGALIAALSDLDVSARRIPGRTGVFAGRDTTAGPDRKIASIGIGLRGWVSWHGFALNVGIDLAGFGWIVPCGLADVQMTSIEVERTRNGGVLDPDLESRARSCVAASFRRWLEEGPA